MSRPGVEITSSAQPLPRSAPTDTSVWFTAGKVGTDPGKPTAVRSITEYKNTFGDRQGGPVLYDAVDAFFREGGSRAWISPVTGTADSQALLDALALFDKGYGPGQVSCAECTDTTGHAGLLAHAAATNRVALLDTALLADWTDPAQLIALGESLQADANARYGAMFSPYAVIPGVAGGTTRTIAYSAIQAGIIARNDVGANPNVAAAGQMGISMSALDLVARYTDQQYQDLNEAGVNMARLMFGLVETYGYRSLVDPAGADQQWLDFGHARLNMAIVAQADVIGQRYVFTQMDGRRKTIARFGGDLRAMLARFYELDALYGQSAQEAFQVNVGPNINTEETIANGELHAQLLVRMSPFAELVVIDIVKVATTVALPGAEAATLAAAAA
jgi:hypothetical protein